jgi:hypothetical protein
MDTVKKRAGRLRNYRPLLDKRVKPFHIHLPDEDRAFSPLCP